jgi:anti-anti-sigma regulatory factor
MLKISHFQAANHTVTLKLEGRVIGPWVAELKEVCDRHLAENRPVNLDFGDVTFADGMGLALLLQLRSRGVTFTNCSPFIDEELRTMIRDQ